MASEQKQPKARVLAYYLPQFHPIPENDEWWGKGFTEWTNVGKAKRYFPGHYQPHVPADLGYYDLRVPETREAQAQMAREAGVEGFVYWHYWFAGKELMERPFKEVLESGKPDFPFALAWANQTWKGFNFGVNNERNVLIEQTYPGDEDYIAHFNAVFPAFKDKRYITCDGKPIFIIYQPSDMPDPKHYIELWQSLAKENGLKGIYFIALENGYFTEKEGLEYKKWVEELGYDAVNYMRLHPNKQTFWQLQFHRFTHYILRWPNIYSYKRQMRWFSNDTDREENAFPCIIPNWDHTPRSGKRGMVFYGSTPELFRQHVHETLERIIHKPFDKRIVIIKSWNEWAEGNYMEPDLKFGKGYLDALHDELFD